MQVALGRTESDEYKDELCHISKVRLLFVVLAIMYINNGIRYLFLTFSLQLLKGNTGLLFSNQPLTAVTKFFDDYCKDNFAPAGIIVNRNILIPEGGYFFSYSFAGWWKSFLNYVSTSSLLSCFF